MSTQKREFSKKRRNGTMRRKMKGGFWPFTSSTNTSSTDTSSTAQVPATSPAPSTFSKITEWFGSFVKKKEPAPTASAGPVAPPTETSTLTQTTNPMQKMGGKRKNKRSRNSKK